MKKIGFLVSILIFIICFSIIGQAQTIDIEVNVGFDGKIKLGGMNPIKIILDAKENELVGDLKIYVGERIYTHPINLKSNTKKEYMFSIPVLKENEKLEVNIEKDGQVIENKTITLKILPKNTVFIGVLSDTPENYYGIKEMHKGLFHDKNIEVIKLNEEMSYTVKELENLNILILDNFYTNNLSNESEEILKKWIANGNILLIGDGKYAYKNLTGFLKGIEEKKNIGDGWVIPVKGNAFINMINKNITPFGINKILNNDNLDKRINASKNLYGAADYLLTPNYKTVCFLFSFLIIYILLLGIFMYFGKKKWLFSSIIMIACIVFYGFSFIGNLDKLKAVSAAVKIYHHGLDCYKFTSIYPDKEDNIRLQFVNGHFIDVLNGTDYVLDPVDKKVDYIIKKDEIDTNEPYSLYREETQCIKTHNIMAYIDNDTFKGEIINPIADKMYNCFLLVGDTVIPLGDLDGKEKKRINYKLDHSLRNLGDYNYLEKIYETAELDDYERQMFEYYFYNIDAFSYTNHLIGFSKGLEKVNVKDGKGNIKEIACNVFDLNMNYKENVYIPCEIIKPITDFEENEDKREFILEDGKEVKVYYAIPKNIYVKAIKLYTKVDGGRIDLEIYNQEENIWEELTSEKLKQEAVTKYISKGPLMIKIKGEGRMMLPQIEIKGNKREAGGGNV
ncbi:hypothetical protein [Crassaminicella indica]|uniref:Uncharacterized protein n=1 Tax=Crassaminicella indica TaxID=2855394 RepID=A0ABX8R9V9_9CLOT|nr:hypothetical protein [Crassaminicella indica]QXM05244.1 hypothetical protein KVH43_07515 [Crassaminicella indica]